MTAPTQKEKAEHFRKLHEGQRAFVIPNPWDGGSARVLAGLGFQALATSSGACAGTFGRRDGKVTRAEALEHARLICSVTDLPVAADLEKGFGDRPEDAAETIRMAADVGLVGGSIEDATGDKDRPLFDFNLAVERVAAAVTAARRHPFPFTLTARTENFLRGNPDLDDTIKRLQAFEKAGADVLFSPGPARPRGGEEGLQRAAEALQLHGRHSRQIVQRRRSRSRRRAPHQPRDLALPCGNGEHGDGRNRSERAGDLRLPGPLGDHAGLLQLPEVMTSFPHKRARCGVGR